MQEAFVVALERWPAEGVPSNPGAWITQVARNGAIDRIRREGVLRDKVAVLERLEALHAEPEAVPGEGLGEIGDDRLRLIFTCCHPALAIEARVALTLRSLGGLSTPEIARALLASESAMAQRIVRAKRKIAANKIPYEVPVAEQMPERLPAVLATLYLIFNEGYLASSSEALVRTELSDEAIRLARLLVAMLPREPEASGLLALMLLTDARRPARLDQRAASSSCSKTRTARSGIAERIAEGLELSRQAAAGGPGGPYTMQARIAAVHAEAAAAGETDWDRIVPPLRMACGDRAEPGRRAQPGSCGGDARRARGRPGFDRRDRGPRRLPPPPRRPRRPAPTAEARCRGGDRLRTSPRPGTQPGRAPLSRTPPCRARLSPNPRYPAPVQGHPGNPRRRKSGKVGRWSCVVSLGPALKFVPEARLSSST